MSKLRALLDRIAALFSRRRREAELAEEIDSHLALSIDENMRRGMSPGDARRAALRSFGGVEQMKETYRDRRSIPFVETFVQDLRHGARSLRRNPAVWALAVLTLAVGLGANATIFTIVRAIFVRPIEMFDPDRTAVLYSVNERQGRGRSKTSVEDYLAWRERSRSFERMVACYVTVRGVTGLAEPERLRVARVSPDFFDFFGARPAAGRFPRPEESVAGRNHVAVLSHGFWTERFARSPDVIGSTLRLDDSAFTVIGVAPAGFWFPSDRAQLWTPFAVGTPSEPFDRSLTVIGRLKAGVGREQARQELAAIARQLESETPIFRAGWGVLMQTPFEGFSSESDRTFIILLYLVSAGVLLVACANIASLLVARALGRRKETAVRAALGAGRARLVRQSLTENLLLALPAGALGVLVALWSANLVLHSLSLTVRLPATLVDARVIAFTFAISVVSVLVFGCVPSLEGARLELAPCLKEGGARAGLGRGSHWKQRAFVVLQTSLALALVSTAALIYKAVLALHYVDPGFRAADLVLVDLKPSEKRYASDSAVRGFYEEAFRRLGGAPLVERAAAISEIPCVDGDGEPTTFALGDRAEPAAAERPSGTYLAATPGAIETLGVPLERGRAIEAGDREKAPRVVVVNRTAANRFWPGQDPIGRRVRLDALDRQWFAVVGVLNDVLRASLTEPPRPQFFVSWEQAPHRGMTVVVRTRAAGAAIPGIRSAIRQVTREAPIEVRTAEGEMYNDLKGSRTVTALFGVFASLALFRAAIGLFSLISQTVGERMREMGIRLVFGANGSDIVRLLLVEGLGLAAIGVSIGLVVAVVLGRVLRTTVLSVRAADPQALAASCFLLALVTLVACYLPARRACRIDPVRVLHSE